MTLSIKHHYMQKIVFFTLVIFILITGARGVFAQETNPVRIYFFYGDGCPHCQREEIFLSSFQETYPDVEIFAFEVWNNPANARLMQDVAGELGVAVNGVPFIVIGDWSMVGYFNDQTSGAEIEERVVSYIHGASYRDVVGGILHKEEAPQSENQEESLPLEEAPLGQDTSESKIFSLPFFGDVSVENFSLPALTVAFGLADGFNPCAMWALLFLIGLLLEMKNRTRMWVLGGVFILVSGLVYFVFMAAWLNLLLFLGFLVWIRFAIGAVAIGGGAWSLKEFFTKTDATCAVEASEGKKKVFERFRSFAHEKNFWIALGGIILLASAVNMVELMCSAGLPAVYTQVLALSNLAVWQYYGYLLLYIFFYMLDDVVVFVVAMTALRLSGLSGKYARWSRLIGGVLMVVLGLLLWFKPEWLMFG